MVDVEQYLSPNWTVNAKIQWDNENVEADSYDSRKKRDMLSFMQPSMVTCLPMSICGSLYVTMSSMVKMSVFSLLQRFPILSIISRIFLLMWVIVTTIGIRALMIYTGLRVVIRNLNRKW